MQPEGYFVGGGVEIEKEYHDGKDLGTSSSYPRFYSVRSTPFLRLKHIPVLSVTTLEEETSAGTWTSRTEGRGNTFLVVENGVRFVSNVPRYLYKNIRVTYKTGYPITPSSIKECSARLAAAMFHLILDASERDTVNIPPMNVGLPEFRLLSTSAFSKSLKNMVIQYKRRVNPKIT